MFKFYITQLDWGSLQNFASNIKQIGMNYFLFPLKLSKNHRFSDNFKGSWCIIHLNLLTFSSQTCWRIATMSNQNLFIFNRNTTEQCVELAQFHSWSFNNLHSSVVFIVSLNKFGILLRYLCLLSTCFCLVLSFDVFS